jgi:hypothetical protein
MDIVGSSETTADFCRTTRRQISYDEIILQINLRQFCLWAMVSQFKNREE